MNDFHQSVGLITFRAFPNILEGRSHIGLRRTETGLNKLGGVATILSLLSIRALLFMVFIVFLGDLSALTAWRLFSWRS